MMQIIFTQLKNGHWYWTSLDKRDGGIWVSDDFSTFIACATDAELKLLGAAR